MPTYEYECKACGHTFEEFQAMSAKPLRVCPECGKRTLERLIGIGAGVLFKGGGFYETDYRSESYTKAAEAEKKGAEKKPDAKPDSKSDSKPDSRSDSKSGSKSETKSDASKNSERTTPKPKHDGAGAKPKKPPKKGE